MSLYFRVAVLDNLKVHCSLVLICRIIFLHPCMGMDDIKQVTSHAGSLSMLHKVEMSANSKR